MSTLRKDYGKHDSTLEEFNSHGELETTNFGIFVRYYKDCMAQKIAEIKLQMKHVNVVTWNHGISVDSLCFVRVQAIPANVAGKTRRENIVYCKDSLRALWFADVVEVGVTDFEGKKLLKSSEVKEWLRSLLPGMERLRGELESRGFTTQKSLQYLQNVDVDSIFSSPKRLNLAEQRALKQELAKLRLSSKSSEFGDSGRLMPNS